MSDETDRGLVYDLATLRTRRNALGLLGGVGLAGLLAACSGDDGVVRRDIRSSSGTSTRRPRGCR